MDSRKCPRCGADLPPTSASPKPGRPARWCSQQCRRAAYEERRAAANGAIAVRIETVEKPVERIVERVRYETKPPPPPTPAEAATIVAASPRACRTILEVLTTRAENGELSASAHGATLRAAADLLDTLARKGLLPAQNRRHQIRL